MTTHRSAFALLLAASALGSIASAAENERHSIAFGGEAGTTGLGASVWWTASSSLVLTVGYGGLDADHDYSTEGVDYEGSADLANGYALLRWHPMKGHFHLSAGAVLANNALSVVGSPENGTTFEIDGVDYPAAQVGSIVGDVEWEKSLVPYFGFGWSKTPQTGGWGAFLDIGVVQSGSATASLNATGPIASDATFQQRLRAEENSVNDELEGFDLFPVARIGLLYRF